MVRLALFDVDGTLIQTKGVGVEAFTRTLSAEFGVVDCTQKVSFGGRTDPSLVRELFEHAAIDPTERNLDRFLSRYVFWLDWLLTERSRGRVCPGVKRFMAELRALPEPPVIGLLTGNIRLGAEIKLRHYGLWGEFEMGAFGDDDEDRNRLAEIARSRGSEMLGCDLRGSEVLVVGDTPRDIECGKAIGARVLAVATGACTGEELKPHRPDWLVSTLEDVSSEQVCR